MAKDLEVQLGLYQEGVKKFKRYLVEILKQPGLFVGILQPYTEQESSTQSKPGFVDNITALGRVLYFGISNPRLASNLARDMYYTYIPEIKKIKDGRERDQSFFVRLAHDPGTRKLIKDIGPEFSSLLSLLALPITSIAMRRLRAYADSLPQQGQRSISTTIDELQRQGYDSAYIAKKFAPYVTKAIDALLTDPENLRVIMAHSLDLMAKKSPKNRPEIIRDLVKRIPIQKVLRESKLPDLLLSQRGHITQVVQTILKDRFAITPQLVDEIVPAAIDVATSLLRNEEEIEQIIHGIALLPSKTDRSDLTTTSTKRTEEVLKIADSIATLTGREPLSASIAILGERIVDNSGLFSPVIEATVGELAAIKNLGFSGKNIHELAPIVTKLSGASLRNIGILSNLYRNGRRLTDGTRSGENDLTEPQRESLGEMISDANRLFQDEAIRSILDRDLDEYLLSNQDELTDIVTNRLTTNPSVKVIQEELEISDDLIRDTIATAISVCRPLLPIAKDFALEVLKNEEMLEHIVAEARRLTVISEQIRQCEQEIQKIEQAGTLRQDQRIKDLKSKLKKLEEEKYNQAINTTIGVVDLLKQPRIITIFKREDFQQIIAENGEKITELCNKYLEKTNIKIRLANKDLTALSSNSSKVIALVDNWSKGNTLKLIGNVLGLLFNKDTANVAAKLLIEYVRSIIPNHFKTKEQRLDKDNIRDRIQPYVTKEDREDNPLKDKFSSLEGMVKSGTVKTKAKKYRH